MYSHPMFRFKDIPGVAMLDMAVCFALESIGLWSVYSALPPDSLIVAAYVFVSIFSLTFMKDFKDVAGDINSLPLKVGIHKAAVICSLLTILPMIPLLYAATSFPRLYLASLIYLVLAARCV
ncbi:UbiA family prenyltransferase [Methanococcoides seepicolus]|uniref:UbiA family prenyltransferase n=1 Tax=Methanococcoides seepicolus TaxID=2828780 RepID=A0A9E4ZGX7_9EURY|nr:UbiA family prenyltransferase [Methanococcoides seepicolus]